MSNPYIGEIRIFGGNFAPAGWAICDGQLLPISENDALFTLIGTTYGGDGESTFALPDLRGRIPIHADTGPGLSPRLLGESAGTEALTITVTQMPAHIHPHAAAVSAGNTSPLANLVADTGTTLVYADGEGGSSASASATAPVGGGQSHDNMMPSLAVNFIISLFGVFPSQT
jgi:microcystin-dependent protein